jgi:two-component system chemotaxis response regulator CheB
VSNYHVFVIGASAGGVEAVSRVVQDLPDDFPAPVFVVLHFPPHASSMFPLILNRAGRLRAAHAIDGERIEPGRIYVAPPDRHMLIKGSRIMLTRGPRENGHRPAIDPLFRTASRSLGRRVVGVILSGTLDDGTAGMAAVKSGGGTTVIQDPDDAAFPGMPRSVLENVAVDYVVPLAQIGSLLAQRAAVRLEGAEEVMAEDVTDISETGTAALRNDQYPGPPSALTCPECGGALWEIQEGEVTRFRCHVGHGYSAEALISAQYDEVEAALWTALRTLEESAEMARRLAERADKRGHRVTADRFLTQSHETEERARLVRNVLTGGRVSSLVESANGDTDEKVETQPLKVMETS